MPPVGKALENITPVQDTASGLMTVIARASSDPTVDVDKLERLMSLYERIEAKRAETAFSEAMNAAQEEMRPVSQDASTPQTRSKYASFAALDNALRPSYTRHGFSLSFDTADGAPESCIRVVCKIAHKAGHSERPHLDMPADGKGAKGGDVMTKTHATMAAVSYARRGLLKMAFNIAEGEWDDDGNSATSPVGLISSDEAVHLTELMEEHGLDVPGFLKWAKVAKIADIRADKYQACLNAIHAKIKAKGGAK